MTPDVEDAYDNMPWSSNTRSTMARNERYLQQLSLQEELSLANDAGSSDRSKDLTQPVIESPTSQTPNSQHSTATTDSGISTQRNTPKTSTELNDIEPALLEGIEMDFTTEKLEELDKKMPRRRRSIRPKLRTRKTKEGAMTAIGKLAGFLQVNKVETMLVNL